jgi:hypothetical protein
MKTLPRYPIEVTYPSEVIASIEVTYPSEVIAYMSHRYCVMKTQARYSIEVTYPSGVIAYMSYRGRTEWCYSQARYHLKTWVHTNGIIPKIVKN